MVGCAGVETAQDAPLRAAVFQADVTPPIGSPLLHGARPPAREIVTPLSARGLILLGADDPVVLCCLDWIGIGNASHDAFREALAEAAGTPADRVAVHTLHQHDAPGSDLAAEALLEEHGLGGVAYNPAFERRAMERLAAAAKKALAEARPVTHLGLGIGRVERVASNRRILGPDGTVAFMRYSRCPDPKWRAAPEGLIAPDLRLVALWHGEQPIAVLTYYATHPMSYYGDGQVNWDFVGMARQARDEAVPGALHLHFNGAGGNITAGKYNDGSPKQRPILTRRLADGMKAAWESQARQPITAADLAWNVAPVALPLSDHMNEARLTATLADDREPASERVRAARGLIFIRRVRAGRTIPVACLSLGAARLLHMPGELFIEYQRAAQAMRPDRFVAMAAYGDYGPGYIGTAEIVRQGGYEARISRIAPAAEKVLIKTMKSLLSETRPRPGSG
jgi:hypothetical protein